MNKEDKYLCVGGPMAGKYVFGSDLRFRCYSTKNEVRTEESYYLERFVANELDIYLWRHHSIVNIFQLMNVLLDNYAKHGGVE